MFVDVEKLADWMVGDLGIGDLGLYSARLIGIMAALVMAVVFLRAKPTALAARLFALASIGVVSYFLIGAGYFSVAKEFRIDLGMFGLVPLLLAPLSAGLMMWFARLLVLEKAQLPGWLIFLFVVQYWLDVAFAFDVQFGCRFETDCDYSLGVLPIHWSPWLLGVVPSSIKLLFIVLANYWVLKRWRDDLVEARRQFSWAFLCFLNVLAAGVIVAEGYGLHFRPDYFPAISEIDAMLMALTMSLFVIRLLWLPSGLVELLEPAGKPGQSPGSAPGIAEAKLNELIALMEQNRLYREHDLSVAQLAKRLDLPEYRLRRLINRQLGYRNFNAFINRYRLQEACERLKSTRLPILTIALDVGFGSITTFNDAFRRQIGVTPSAYRSS